MIEHMGGHVSVQSTEGEGTIFSIDLSAKTKPKQASQAPQAPNALEQIVEEAKEEEEKEDDIVDQDQDFKFTCLVANDNDFQLMIQSLQLKKLGIKVVKEAINGIEAFKYVQENTE
jgi:hypothetical protein